MSLATTRGDLRRVGYSQAQVDALLSARDVMHQKTGWTHGHAMALAQFRPLPLRG